MSAQEVTVALFHNSVKDGFIGVVFFSRYHRSYRKRTQGLTAPRYIDGGMLPFFGKSTLNLGEKFLLK